MNLVRVLAALALVAPLFPADLNLDIPYSKFVLPNGLTVLVNEDHKAPVVAVNVWYHVGSKNERPGKTGFAHLFEHLMFGGSEHLKTRYIDAMERIGATDLNGTTNEDRTNYFETVPTSALDYTLFLESDRMGHLLGSFDKKTLDLQRGVVQNEKRQGENEPYGVVEELITNATFPAKHPYSWSVIGSMDDLNAASLPDVKDWFKTYYGPSNAVISIAGDVDAQTVKSKVEKYFGDIPAGPPVAHQEVWVAKMTGTQRERVEDRVPQARLYKVWNIPPYSATDTDYLDLVSDCLSQGKTSRLYKRLVYDDQVATDVRASIDPREIAGQFYITATAKPGENLSKIEAAVDDELRKFIAQGPSAAEMERVKAQYVARFVRGLDHVGGFGGKSDVLAHGQVYSGNPAAYKTHLANVNSARPEDLQAAAKRWLSDGQFVLEVHPFPSYTAKAEGVDRSKLPDPGTPPSAKLPKLQRATLSNGLKIIVAERHELPLVDFWLDLDAGYAADQFALPGTASLTSRLLADGTATRDALAISDELESLGAQMQAYANLDTSIVRLYALRSKLDPSLALFADVALHPSFPQADFEREKKQRLAAIEQEKVTPFAMALRIFPTVAYGAGHAYGNPLTGSGTPESVGKISREDLVKFHRAWFRPNAATLVVVGDTTLAEIRPKLEKLFGGWTPGEVPKKNLANVQLPAKPIVYLVDRPGSQQSIIIAGDPSLPRNNPQEAAIDIMNDLVGGSFGSRLNMNLREDKHWSYGSFTAVFSARGQSPFLAVAPVQTDKTKESIQEVSRELHDVVSGRPITADELTRGQANKILALPGSLETMSEVGNAINTLVQFSFPDSYYDTYAARIQALTTGGISDAAQTVIHPDKLIWVIVGDRQKIEPEIRALNLGEVRILTSDGAPSQ